MKTEYLHTLSINLVPAMTHISGKSINSVEPNRRKIGIKTMLNIRPKEISNRLVIKSWATREAALTNAKNMPRKAAISFLAIVFLQ